MDEKTEELRDIFMDVSGAETVTESQTQTRGTLADAGEADDERLRAVVEEMRDRYEFATDFGTDAYVRLARAFYDDATDAEIADEIGASVEEAFRARTDLHLLREADGDASLDLGALRSRRDEGVEALASEFGVEAEAVRRCRRVLEKRDEARAANHRYQLEFDELLTDAELSGRFTDAVRDDGLEEAAKDIETNVSF